MRRRRITSVDRDTGEVLDGVVVYCGVKQNPYSKGWVMNSQEALELLGVVLGSLLPGASSIKLPFVVCPNMAKTLILSLHFGATLGR